MVCRALLGAPFFRKQLFTVYVHVPIRLNLPQLVGTSPVTISVPLKLFVPTHTYSRPIIILTGPTTLASFALTPPSLQPMAKTAWLTSGLSTCALAILPLKHSPVSAPLVSIYGCPTSSDLLHVPCVIVLPLRSLPSSRSSP